MKTISLAIVLTFAAGCSDGSDKQVYTVEISEDTFPPALRKQFDRGSLADKIQGNEPLTKIELVNVSDLATKVLADTVWIDETNMEVRAKQADVTRDFTYHVMFTQDNKDGLQLIRLQDASDGWPWYILAEQVVYVSVNQ
jgi:hypothetical protein